MQVICLNNQCKTQAFWVKWWLGLQGHVGGKFQWWRNSPPRIHTYRDKRYCCFLHGRFNVFAQVLGKNGLRNGRTASRYRTQSHSYGSSAVLYHTHPIPQTSHHVTSGSSLHWKWAFENVVLQWWKIKENTNSRLRAIKKEDFHLCYNWIDRWNKRVQMEITSKAIKFVNHGFHIIKNYSHIPGTFWMLLILYNVLEDESNISCIQMNTQM
jgi:hypothetical protein